MITNEALELLYKNAKTIKECQNLLAILQQKKDVITHLVVECAKKSAAYVADIPLDISEIRMFVETLEDNEIKALESLALQQMQNEKMLASTKQMIEKVKIKMNRLMI